MADSVPSPADQAEQLRTVMEGAGAKLVDGDDWFVVSMRWWDLWKDFTRYGGGQDGDSIKRTTSGVMAGEQPPEIFNSDLLVRPESGRLQKGLMEHRDFMLLHKDAWDLVSGWYGGGPALKRKVIAVGESRVKELRVELYPYWLSVLRVDKGGMPQQDTKMDVTFSRSETIQKVLQDLCTNLEIPDTSNDTVRLWHRSSFEVDQTDTEALEGWEQLEPLTQRLEELGVVDGASLLLEQPNVVTTQIGVSGHTKETTTWPFFQRLRIDYKKQHFKDPSDSAVRLEMQDKIDASAVVEKRDVTYVGTSYSERRVEMKEVETWFAATVIGEEGDKVLLQFHNREKPKAKQMDAETLIDIGATAEGSIVVDERYEGLDNRGDWHPIRITAQNPTGTYVAFVEDDKITWGVVLGQNVRYLSKLTELAVVAFTKVFDRYASDGKIEGGALRGLLSCATNDYVPEDSKRVLEFLKAPYGDENGVTLEGFLEYWRARLAASGFSATGGTKFWVREEVGRLFERVGAQFEKQTEDEKLLAQGQEWIERTSKRLAQYRSKSEPGYNDKRSFRDWRRYDQVDVYLDGEWKQGMVTELSWSEMTVLVRTKEVMSSGTYQYAGSSSSTFKAQSEWFPMESDRLAEYQTKSLEGPEDADESDPVPLLARSTSRGGVCMKPGACGLQNIGNTCFMNATLQCLSNTAALRYFFAGGPEEAPAFASQICTSPLSMQGKLAREFSRVLRQMWSNTNTSIAPAQLKKLIGNKRPEFSGYQQHDAHELLGFLLDGLHEDVNRAPYPPENPEDIEPDGKTEEEIAAGKWQDYLKRNDSKIVELFQFQIRSELECPVTGNKSITFDPIMYLSLPVPKPPHSVGLTVIPLDFPATPMSTLNVVAPSTATFAELEAEVWNHLGRKPSDRNSCFSFADVLSDRIFKNFEKKHKVSEIRACDKVYAIEVQLLPDVAEGGHTFVPVVFRQRKRSTYSSMTDWMYEKCAPPRILAVTASTKNSEVFSQLKGMTEAMLNGSKVPEPWDYVVVGQMDTYGIRGGTNLENDDAVFTVPELAGVDFINESGREMKDGLPKIAARLPGSSAPGGTSLYKCLEKNAEREQLSEFDSAYCSKCKEHRRQYKTLSLWSLPPILIVHLKRFGRERIDGPLEKISCPVDFPMDLDLSAYIRSPDVASQFELIGVVNHGGNVGGGHYTAHAKVTSTSDLGTESGEWFSFNDSTAKRASEADLDNEAAYILFYRRK